MSTESWDRNEWLEADAFWIDGLCTESMRTVDDQAVRSLQNKVAALAQGYRHEDLTTRRPLFAETVVTGVGTVAHLHSLGCFARPAGDPTSNRRTEPWTNDTGAEVRVFPDLCFFMARGHPHPEPGPNGKPIVVVEVTDPPSRRKAIPFKAGDPILVPPWITFRLELAEAADAMLGAVVAIFASNVQRLAEDDDGWSEPDAYWRLCTNNRQSTEARQEQFDGLFEQFSSPSFRRRFYPNHDESTAVADDVVVSKVEARIRGLGCFVEAEAPAAGGGDDANIINNDDDDRCCYFTNTTAFQLHVVCISALEGDDGQEEGTLNGSEVDSEIATVETDAFDGHGLRGLPSRPFVYGETQVVAPGDAVRITLRPNVAGAVLVALFGLTKEEEVSRRKEKEEEGRAIPNDEGAEDQAKCNQRGNISASRVSTPQRQEPIEQQFTMASEDSRSKGVDDDEDRAAEAKSGDTMMWHDGDGDDENIIDDHEVGWHEPPKYWRVLGHRGGQPHKDVLKTQVAQLLEQFSSPPAARQQYFSSSPGGGGPPVAVVEARIRDLGCFAADPSGPSIDDDRVTSCRVTNTTSFKLYLACIFSVELSRSSPTLMAKGIPLGSEIATMEVIDEGGRPDRGRPFVYGQSKIIMPGDTARIALRPNVGGAVLVALYGQTEQDLKRKKRETQLAAFERNKKSAADEARWLKVGEFFDRNQAALPGLRRKDVHRQMTAFGFSNRAQKAAEVRLLGRGAGESWTSTFLPNPCAATIWCPWAQREDGTIAEPGAWVAGRLLPDYAIRVPIYVGKRESLAASPQEEENEILQAYHLEEKIQRAVIVRVPQFRADQDSNNPGGGGATTRGLVNSMNQHLNLSAGGSSGGRKIATEGVADASRKVTTCEGCGVPWRKSKPMPCCMRCQAVRYCSKICQRGHWMLEHKKVCQPVVVAAAAASSPPSK